MAVQRALPDFETWKPNYGGAQVYVYRSGSSNLASLFLDEGLTSPAVNPQVLQSLIVGDIIYGRLTVPVYCNEAVEWEINGSRSGVIRPGIALLDGENANNARVTATGATRARDLDDRAADFVNVEDFGEIGTSGATNTATLNAAIGAVAAKGGGEVRLPQGVILVTQITLPDGVLLRGRGRGATILQSQTGNQTILLGGDRAGLADLTLDGINLIPGSIGILTLNKNETRLHDIEIKRFETCLWSRGGRRQDWRDLYITNAVNGARLWGDSALGSGGQFRDNLWRGGRVIQCTGVGVELSFEDQLCIQSTLIDVGFEDNTGPALKVNGARFTRLHTCWFSGNTTPIDIRDDDNTSLVASNTVQGFVMLGGGLSGGSVTLRDSLIGVLFKNVNISGVTFAVTAPKNNILLQDCIEDSAVVISGIGTAITRRASMDQGASSGLTSGNTPTKAWSTGELAPGEVVFLTASVVANQVNGASTAEYYIAVSAKRPGSTLAYDSQTANFTLGQIVTGATSGAKGLVIADADGGATGTLTLRNITGAFLDNEVLTDPLGGSALVNGSLVPQNAALLGAVTALRAAREDVAGWDATFVANGPEIELQVTGAAATTIDWVPLVSQVRNG